ncbi:MAG TPA: T9SS type A sorting domain-containing protein [Saprospiraceae bacterium]|nr:T9SS type A sorting domain-containing protein [Saprospiraceae bacterium]
MKSVLTFLVVVLTTTILFGQLYVKQDAIGTNDGTSWTNAFTKLQFALEAASPGDQIWIAAGKYVPTGSTPDSSHFIVTTPVNLYGGFNGTETSLQQRDWNSNLTIISGDILGDDQPGDFNNHRADNAHHVLIVDAGETQTIIDGLIFESGATRLDANSYFPDANDIPYNRWCGGALYIHRSGVTIQNCLFRDNDAVRGSGFFAFGDTLATIRLVVENTFFMNNHGYNGAASFTQAFRDYKTNYCRFINNSAYQGGAVFLSNTDAQMEECIFNGNTATYGGAMLAYHGVNEFNQHPVTTLTNCDFINNSASSWGGAIYVNNSYKASTFLVDGGNFRNNYGTGFGGGIMVEDRQDNQPDEEISLVQITNSKFEDNTAFYGGGVDIEPGDDSIRIDIQGNNFIRNGNIQGIGGGMYISGYERTRAFCQIKNNSFTNNTAYLGGGALIENYNNINTLSYEIDNCVFAENEALNEGGGLVVRSYPLTHLIDGTITNSIFRNNKANLAGGAIYANGGKYHIENSDFNQNYTDGSQDTLSMGGGAIVLDGQADVHIERSKFEGNASLTEGAAIYTIGDVNWKLENSLFVNHSGESALYNSGTLNMLNVTLSDQLTGLIADNGSITTVQNSVLNTGSNLIIRGGAEIISQGGNISSDNTMTSFLTGSGDYQDLNQTDPLLGPDMCPVAGSPCIDMGNPDGITQNAVDIDGNPRIQGNGIDAGCFETIMVSVQNTLKNSINLEIFPNPTSDELNVNLSDAYIGKADLSFFNNNGQVVLESTLDKTQTEQSFPVNIRKLPAGNYVLFVKLGNRAYSNDLIIQR